MHKPAAVALHGFVYSTNFGDMLLSRLSADIVRRNAPDAKISLPFARRVFLRAAGINCATGLHQFLRADALLYHGGGYFAFSPRFDLLKRARLFKRFYAPGFVAAKLKKPYGIFGVGVGPIRTAIESRAVRHMFQGASLVSVRDEEGLDWLRRIGVSNGNIHLAADLAASLDWGQVPEQAVHEADRLLAAVQQEKRIGIHLSAPPGAGREYDAVARGIITFADRHPEMGFVLVCDHLAGRNPHETPQYRAAVELVGRLGPRASVVGQPPLWTLVALLGKLDGLVTNKLHAGIVSSAFGRRVVSIAKNEKNFRFFRQIGAESRCISLAEAKEADVPDFLERGFESLHVPVPLPAPIRELSKKNELLIQSFLADVGS